MNLISCTLMLLKPREKNYTTPDLELEVMPLKLYLQRNQNVVAVKYSNPTMAVVEPIRNRPNIYHKFVQGLKILESKWGIW